MSRGNRLCGAVCDERGGGVAVAFSSAWCCPLGGPEAYSGAREPSWLGALLTPSPTVLHRLTVLSHPRLAREIMDGNRWQLSKESPSLLERNNKGRLEGEQDIWAAVFFCLNTGGGECVDLISLAHPIFSGHLPQAHTTTDVPISTSCWEFWFKLSKQWTAGSEDQKQSIFSLRHFSHFQIWCQYIAAV